MTRSYPFARQSVVTCALALWALTLPRLALAAEPAPDPSSEPEVVASVEGPAEAPPSLPAPGAVNPVDVEGHGAEPQPQTDPQPTLPRGRGLIIGGSVMLGVGTTVATVGGLVAAVVGGLDLEPSVPGITIATLGAATAVGGAAMLGVGVHRNNRWRNSARLQVQPSFGAGPSGASLGLRGRF